MNDPAETTNESEPPDGSEKEETGNRVFKYGANAPTKNLDVVFEQFKLAHRYRNLRCEIELQRRAEVDEALARLSPELLAVEDLIGNTTIPADPETGAPAVQGFGVLGEIETLQASARRLRIKARTKNVKDPAIVSALKKLRFTCKQLFATRKAIRAELFKSPEWIESQRAINLKENLAIKKARNENGLYWGTSGEVDDAAKSMRRKAPPEFRCWADRKDKIAVQKSMTLEKLLSGTSRLAKLTVSHRPHAIPGSNRYEQLLAGVLSLRIGSNPDRSPIWAEIPIAYHRELPLDAQIQRIFCTRRDLGCQSVWSVQFLLRAEKDAWVKTDLACSGRVGIDVGWRSMKDGRLRVAVWAGDDGSEGELALPVRWREEMEKVKRIKSERDKLLDSIKPFISDWTKTLEDAKEYHWIPHSRSQNRMRSLIERLAARGEIVPDELNAWRLRDRHLLDYEAHTRDQLQTSRKHLYRNFAARMTRAYKEIRIESLDLRDFHVLPPVEDGLTAEEERMRKNTRNACISTLIEALKSRGSDVTAVEAAETTTRCHACGSVDSEWTDHLLLLHSCSACGLEWDQDVNAARNILGAEPDGGWEREPYAPDDVTTYTATGPNRAERQAAARAAKEAEEKARANEPQVVHVVELARS